MEGAHRRNFATWPLCLHQQPSAIVVVMVRRPPHVVTALITCEPSEADRVVSRWARIVELTAKQGEHSRGDGILLGSELAFLVHRQQ